MGSENPGVRVNSVFSRYILPTPGPLGTKSTGGRGRPGVPQHIYAVFQVTYGILCCKSPKSLHIMQPGGALKFTLLCKAIFDLGKLCRQLGRAAGSATAFILNRRNRGTRKTKSAHNGTPVTPHRGRAKNSWEIFADFGSHNRGNRLKPQHGRRKSTTVEERAPRATRTTPGQSLAPLQLRLQVSK